MANSAQNKAIHANDDDGKRGTSDGYMKKAKTFNYSKATPAERKAWLKQDRSVAPVKAAKTPAYPMKGGSFIDQLEKHKEIGASFDNGTWKPRYKGQTFTQAIDEHKEASAGKFR